MLTTSIDKENHIIEMTIAGKISREELKKAIEEIEAPISEWENLRVLKRVDSFRGIEMAAFVDDLKFAYENFSHLKRVKKVAVVTDVEWVETITKLMKSVLPYEIEVFENEDIEEARAWLK